MNGLQSPASQRFGGLVPFFQPLQRLLALIIAILVIETFLGHPGLRTEWTSRTGEVEHMISCHVLSITWERQVIFGNKSLICFITPAKERTLRYWLLRPVTRWFS